MASKKPPEVPRRTPEKGPKANFVTAPDASPGLSGGKGVRVTPGAGGAGSIGPAACTSKRAAPNVREGAYGHH